MRLFCAAIAAASLACFASPVLADTTGLVRGNVTLGGKPASGVTITLTGEGGTRIATTDARGVFTIPRVGFGRYTLVAHRTGGADFAQPVDVASGAVVDLPIELGLRTIGRTQSAFAKGVASTPVSANSLTSEQLRALPQNQSLDRVIATFPGVAQFSYNEPVAHGFHGLTYEIDGVPLPSATASNFSEIIDPRTIDSLEVFTGAFPAEYGGQRQGAVVNIISHRQDLSAPDEGLLTVGGGSYGSAQSSLSGAFTAGRTRVFLNANLERTNRGIDSPTFDPVHDGSSQSDQFLRTITNVGAHDTLAFNASNNVSRFQIPINTTPNSNDPLVVPPSTDDNQLEYSSFLNLSYINNTANGNAYTQIAPWYLYSRVRYLGDIPNDLAGGIDGLVQDRHSNFEGVRLTHFHVFGNNAVKAGVDESVENFGGNLQVAYFNTDANGNPTGPEQNFFDLQAQRGSNLGAYIEDKWTPTTYLSLRGGLRYDHSTGYVAGGQLSPRIEINGQIDPETILHAYYGRLYAAPFLEDTRAAAVILGGGAPTGALPVYNLQPERDSYYEFGLAHRLAPGATATLNFWKRDVYNVLDTTQLANTPLFAVFNNTIGVAKGVEGRINAYWPSGDSLFFSTALSTSLAGGISGGTFLFPPSTDPTDVTLNPEDHDQQFNADLAYTKRLGAGRNYYATLESQYGTGYPVQFENGPDRLTPHLVFSGAFGREAKRGTKSGLGFEANFQNFTNSRYLIKVNNGFNTTQWGQGFQADFRVTAPF